MFKSLEDVVIRWAKRFDESGLDEDLLPVKGYDAIEIEAVAYRLNLKLHPSLVNILGTVNLDSVSFGRCEFGGGSNYLRYLTVMNDGTYMHYASEDNFINIGGAGRYIVLLNNRTGVVYINDMYGDAQVQAVANSLEEFILRAAEIAEKRGQNLDSRSGAIEATSEYLDEQGIDQGREFWTDLLMDTV